MMTNASSFRRAQRVTTLLTAALFGFAGCGLGTVIGSGHVVSEVRPVSGFHGVQLRGTGKVIVTQGETEGLVIEAEDNILPLVESSVGADGVLRLGFKGHHVSVATSKGLVFRLAVKSLDRLALGGSGSIEAGTLSAAKLAIELPGSGRIRVDGLRADAVSVELGGSGKITLAGTVRAQKLALDGSGSYEAENLKSGTAAITIDGSGGARVWAEGSLAVEINGSGSVAYYGRPAVQQKVNGVGSVRSQGIRGQ